MNEVKRVVDILMQVADAADNFVKNIVAERTVMLAG